MANGITSHPLFFTWRGMIARCYNPKHKAYKWYGARGIGVCDRWRTSCADFVKDMGPKPTRRHSIDRINNDGDYEPSNCVWATPKQQASNRKYRGGKYQRFLTHDGRTQSLTQWAKEIGITHVRLHRRMQACERRGVDVSEAFTTPYGEWMPSSRWWMKAGTK